MKINEKKLESQKDFLEKWKSNGFAGTLEATTGYGKTYCSILRIKEINRDYPGEYTNVVVPRISLYEDWTRPGVGHIEYYGLSHVRVYVVNTYTSDNLEVVRDCRLLVCDEVHHYSSLTAVKFSTVFDISNYQEVMGLSATLEDHEKEFLKDKGLPILVSIPQREAEMNGFVAPSLIFNYLIELDENERRIYDEIESEYKKRFHYFEYNFDLARACSGSDNSVRTLKYFNGIVINRRGTAGEFRTMFARHMGWKSESNHKYSPTHIIIASRRLFEAIRARKNFLYNNNAKLKAATNILNSFSKFGIVFSESSEFADKLSSAVSETCVAYHSNIPTQIRLGEKVLARAVKVRNKTLFKGEKTGNFYTYDQFKSSVPGIKKVGGKKIREEAMNKFKSPSSRVRYLSTVKMLDEGFDYAVIDLVLMASYTSKKRQDTQRKGRGIRIDPTNIKKSAIIINLAVKNTQEETGWLKYKQEDFDGTIVEVESVQEIKSIIREFQEGKKFDQVFKVEPKASMFSNDANGSSKAVKASYLVSFDNSESEV